MKDILVPSFRSAGVEMAAGDQSLELVEVNGIRYWQVLDGVTGKPQPRETVIRKLALDQRMRSAFGLNRGLTDYVRVIGRWLLGREDRLVESLVRQYDVETVPEERLLTIAADGSLVPFDGRYAWDLNGKPTGDVRSVLLLIHGTFSKTASPVAGLGHSFLECGTSVTIES